MEENKKQFNWKTFIIVVMAGMLIFCLAKINQLLDYNAELENRIANHLSELSILRNEINSIYDNVDEQLKKEASLLSGVDFSIGELNEDNGSVAVDFIVVPKVITDDMKLSVAVDGKTTSLTKNGSEFTGTIDVGLFIEYDRRPLLTIETADGLKTEYLEDIDLSYMFHSYLPALYAEMSESTMLSDGKLHVDLGFSVKSSDVSITFTSFTLIEEVNGREVAQKDITSDVRKAGENYNIRYVETFEVSQSDELNVYVIAEDSLGYIHKTLAYYWYEPANGGTTETIFAGEWIYDSEGNLLYGE